MIEGIVETEVNGIRTLLARGSGQRVSAGLTFRVGRADETLATSGITHLVEHLALHGRRLAEGHFNGETADVFTHFHIEGTAAGVVEHLNGVCRALGSLPVDRLETEKEILRTEATGRGPAPMLPAWRYGAQSYGLSSYQEIGLARLSAVDVEHWARTRFTRDNVVLWISAEELPVGFELDLPGGEPVPPPRPESVLPVPAWIPGPENLAVSYATVERSTAATVATRVLGRRLFVELQEKGGLSYAADAVYTPIDQSTAVITAVADCSPEKADALVGALVDVFAGLRYVRVPDEELDFAKASVCHPLLEQRAELFLATTAMNLLLGRRVLSQDELLAEIDAVTAADVQQVLETVWSGALTQVPAIGLSWAGVERAPGFRESASGEGAEYFSLGAPAEVLVVGEHGVTVRGEDYASTVAFRDCAGLLTWPDGARQLIDRDGFQVSIEPTLFDGLDPIALAAIDARVDSGVVLPMPRRSPEQIPQPSPVASLGRDRAASPTRARTWMVLWALLAGWIGFITVRTVSLTSSAANGGDATWEMVITAWAVLGLSLALGWWAVRRA